MDIKNIFTQGKKSLILITSITMILFLSTFIGCSQATNNSQDKNNQSQNQTTKTEDQGSKELSDALKNGSNGYFNSEDLETLKKIGGLPIGQGQTYYDSQGCKCMAFAMNERGDIKVIQITDSNGNEQLNVTYDANNSTTTYKTVDNTKSVEEFTTMWVPVYEKNTTNTKYLFNDGSTASYPDLKIVGYKSMTCQEYNQYCS